MMATPADDARGARSYPTAKSALRWNHARTMVAQNMKLATEGRRQKSPVKGSNNHCNSSRKAVE